MSRSGVNMAITQDGETYNKLRRPDHFVAPLTPNPSPQAEMLPVSAISSAPDASKRKRKEPEISEGDYSEEPESKRPREQNVPRAGAVSHKALAGDSRRISRPLRDCGMQSMFPGIDGEASSDDDTQEALAYLRSVRSEASAIPNTLTAPPEIGEDDLDRSMYNDGRGDYRAVYKNGTWVAVDPYADDAEDAWSDDSYELDPQEQYYNSLLKRYEALRTTLASADPQKLAAQLKADPDKPATPKPPSNKSQWLYTLESTYPTPAALSQLSAEDINYGLGYCASTVARFETISKQRSCWMWTLLALAGDLGTLDHFKVGRIRDLGNKAGQLLVRLSNQTRPHPPSDDKDEDVEEWEVDGEGTDGSEDVDDAVENGEDLEHDDSKNVIPEMKPIVSDAETDNNEPDKCGTNASPVVLHQADNSGAHLNITSSQPAEIPEPVEKEGNNDSTNIPTSNGEVVEQMGFDPEDDEAIEVEAARARLLAQLGSRLVKTSIPDSPIPKYQLHQYQLHRGSQYHGTAREGGRHRHNGRICDNPACRFDKGRQEAHRRAGSRAAKGNDVRNARSSGSSSNIRPTRTEAELRRQQIRAQELGQTQDINTLKCDDIPTVSKEQIKPTVSATGSSDAAASKEEVSNAVDGMKNNREQKKQTDEFEKRDDVQLPNECNSPDAGNVNPIDLNTRVTIDMILTVVAERYGQKDLLRYREVW